MKETTLMTFSADCKLLFRIDFERVAFDRAFSQMSRQFWNHKKDKTIDFDADQFITAPVASIQASLPQLGMVRNGDLEIPVDSALFSVATGEQGVGFTGDGDSTLETLYSKDAPEGDAYLKWTPSSSQDRLRQNIVVGDDFDPEAGFQIDASSSPN